MKSFIVDDTNKGQRLNKYCQRILRQAPQSFIYKMMRKKNITLNGSKASGSEVINAGDEVKFFLSDETFDKFAGVTSGGAVRPAEKGRAEDAQSFPTLAPEDIVFENSDIIIVHKKAGELSQKVKPEDVSVNERIVGYLSADTKDPVKFTPGVCNRLDRGTEGLVIAAKNAHASAVIGGLLKDRKLEKYYLATVEGSFRKETEVSLYLTKDEMNNKVTLSPDKTPGSVLTRSVFYPLFTGERYSVVRVKLETGKSHQIRAQLSYLGFPIVGDRKYGRSLASGVAGRYGIKGQMLLAYELKFPEDFSELPGLRGRSFKARIPASAHAFWKGEDICLHGIPED